jgi:3-hydroxybenzoate 6-monooxygenase
LCNAAQIGGIMSEADSVRVRTVDGQSFEAKGLIGADGLWSVVRSTVFSAQAPRYSGDMALRALIPCTREIREVTLWLGPQLHVVAYPVKAGNLLNVVAICANPKGNSLRGWDEQAPSEWLHKFTGHHRELDQLLEGASRWTAWALHDRDPIQSWSKGRVVLVGDAAHPCLQYLAQGACLALEDAVAIAGHLAQPRDTGNNNDLANPSSAFSAFSQERAQRGARMIRTARRMGQLYHAAGPMRQIRNLGMQLTPDWISREAMAWIYEA